MEQRRQALLVPVALAAVLVGCSSGSQPHTQTPSTSSPSMTPLSPTTAKVDPAAQPAVDAYLSFGSTADKAQRKPRRLGEPIDPAADFTQYSFDPVMTQEATYVLRLAQNGWAVRGTAPSRHPQVESVNLTAEPYPTVTLHDCVLAPADWQEYDVKTGKPVPNPYATRQPLTTQIQVIQYQGHWGVYKMDNLEGQPCNG